MGPRCTQDSKDTEETKMISTMGKAKELTERMEIPNREPVALPLDSCVIHSDLQAPVAGARALETVMGVFDI
jgi:hypothetical protein